ncbi:MAG: NAD(P)-dependent oxidoreductase [Actinomycetota bacterium]|nr:NAD(P)-dependent oxidoreductase [Actinomycetota bacterium]
MAQPSALVTGASGFIGARLVPALLVAGWTVRAVGRRRRPAWMPTEVDYRVVDLAEDDLGGISRGITHVFHLAGASSSLSSTDEMHRSNVVATERLMASLLASDVERLVYLSSTSVYGEAEQLALPVREDVEPEPSRAYGKAKLQAEQAVWSAGEAGLAVVVLRPVSVYGPGNVKLLGSIILDAAVERFAGRQNLPVYAEPIEVRLVHIDDVVRASLFLSVHGGAVGRAFNLVFPQYPTSHGIVEIVGQALGMTPELSDDPECGLTYDERVAQRSEMLNRGMQPDILLTEQRFRFLRRANRNNRLSVDALLSTGFQFTGTDAAEAIGRVVTWYEDNRWIVRR